VNRVYARHYIRRFWRRFQRAGCLRARFHAKVSGSEQCQLRRDDNLIFFLNLVSVMKKKFEKEAMEDES
jgi:hypothetical protein